jgi:hypothetical protein
MAVMIECLCHRKQSIKNKKCPSCGQNLDKVKKSEKAQYWINFYLGKKLKWERITNKKGESKLSDAQAAMAKRRGQKREGTLESILDLKRIEQDRMTLQELSDLYTGQEHWQEKPGYSAFCRRLRFFNNVYGTKRASSIERSDLLKYQAQRKREGAAHSTIDQEIAAIRKVINAGYLDKKISHQEGPGKASDSN